MRVTAHAGYAVAGVFAVVAIWAAFGFAFPSQPLPLALNVISKICTSYRRSCCLSRQATKPPGLIVRRVIAFRSYAPACSRFPQVTNDPDNFGSFSILSILPQKGCATSASELARDTDHTRQNAVQLEPRLACARRNKWATSVNEAATNREETWTGSPKWRWWPTSAAKLRWRSYRYRGAPRANGRLKRNPPARPRAKQQESSRLICWDLPNPGRVASDQARTAEQAPHQPQLLSTRAHVAGTHCRDAS
jgi:hypothetical protein